VWLGAGAVVMLLFSGVAAWAVLSIIDSQHESAIAQAASTASSDGLGTSLGRALQLAEEHAGNDDDDLALRARLAATAALEHAAGGRAEQAERLLAKLSGQGARLPDAQIARIYVLLAAGRVGEAQRHAAAASPPYESAEISRALALTAFAAGDLEKAVEHSGVAATRDRGAPRHAALFGLVTALAGDARAADETLTHAHEGAASPAIRVARARVLLSSGSDPARAVEEAEAVLGPLADRATPVQRAWALLVKAQVAAESGDPTAARSGAHEAAELAPPGDERFGLTVAETLLRAGDAVAATRVLESLPSESVETERRARAEAEAALARRDFPAVTAALERAGETAQTAFLRGMVAEARGERAAAVAAYEEAAEDPRQFVRARTRLGALHIRSGNARRAVELMLPAHERAPNDLDLVPLFVQALVRVGQVERAGRVVTSALSRRGDVPELLAARARVELAHGHGERALATLRQAAAARPDDPAIQLAVATTAAAAGDTDTARAAFERTLELRPGDAGALAGLLELAIDEGDDEAANAALARARAARVPEAQLDRAQARLMVARGEGEAALPALRELVEGSTDARLWLALGQALYHAERDDEASDALTTALEHDRGNPRAYLTLALIRARAAQLAPANRNLAAARREAQRRGIVDRFAPMLDAAEARIAFETGDYGRARSVAERVIGADPRSAEAHFVLALISIEGGDGDALASLRAAVDGRSPPPEAVGQLALRTRGDEACRLARLYLARAPEGYDAPDVGRVASRCR
jgi:tetratricopeptide (TPR) repeat protein